MTRRLQRGQASIEYLVVLAFGVIVLLKPFSYDDIAHPGTPATQAPALQQLANAIKDYHKHYTYAMSIAAIPDCDMQFAYDKSTSAGDVATLSGSIAVGFDRCVDWTNPQIPGLTVSNISASLSIPTTPAAVGSAISQIVTDAVRDNIDKFTNPGDLLGDMLGFKPSDFF